MNTAMGYKKKSSSATEGDVVRANQFNHFYNSFDNPAPAAAPCPVIILTSPPHQIPVLFLARHLDY